VLFLATCPLRLRKAVANAHFRLLPRRQREL